MNCSSLCVESLSSEPLEMAGFSQQGAEEGAGVAKGVEERTTSKNLGPLGL